MLTAHEGNSEAAFQVRTLARGPESLCDTFQLQELNKAQLKPFLMRIWGQQEAAGKENNNEPAGGGEGEGRK